MTAGWWTLIILGALLVVFWVIASIVPEPTKVIKGSDLQKTKEGRDWLVAWQDNAREGEVFLPLVVKPCKSCEGGGIVIGESRELMGTMTNIHHCPDCGGTGLEGGTDYIKDYCSACVANKRVSSSCPICGGTGVMKVRKGEVKNG